MGFLVLACPYPAELYLLVRAPQSKSLLVYFLAAIGCLFYIYLNRNTAAQTSAGFPSPFITHSLILWPAPPLVHSQTTPPQVFQSGQRYHTVLLFLATSHARLTNVCLSTLGLFLLSLPCICVISVAYSKIAMESRQTVFLGDSSLWRDKK